MRLNYLILKESFLVIWKIYIFLKIFFNRKQCNKKLRIFYGGSKSGNVGGPLVKIQKLKREFPEYTSGFNLVYLLSNNSYLSKTSLNILKKRKIPIILNQNGVYYKSWFKGNYLERNKSMANGYHLADYVLWQSKFCKKTSDKFLGKRVGDGEILYNSVDTNLFKPEFKNKKIFTFLITGNINKENSYRIISVFKAIKKLRKFYKNFNLYIAGNVENNDFLELKSNEMRIADKVKFIGRFNQFDAPKIYNLADAYITMTYKDNCPTAVLEAMSSGLPIIYSASGGIPELVDNNSGIGLDVESSWNEVKTPRTSKIVNGMKRIIENKRSMSEAARIRAVENFDIKFWKKRHELIFDFLTRK